MKGKKMTENEHLQMKWKATRTDGRFDIHTDELGMTWYVATVRLNLFGDETGELTARHICELHNQALKGKTE
jgi:hypothetical protein